jgi:hypothetical protein
MRASTFALSLLVSLAVQAADKSVAVTITALEGDLVQASARAEDVQIAKVVPWQRADGTGEPPAQRYGLPQPANLSCELVFDGGADVTPQIQPLLQMAQKNQTLQRPPMVRFKTATISFKGVIDQVSVHYTLYLADGTPVRARVSFHMREASGAETQPQ